MQNRQKGVLIIGLGLVLLFGGIFLAAQCFDKRENLAGMQSPIQQQVPTGAEDSRPDNDQTSFASIKSSEWKKFKNDSFEIEYPVSFLFDENIAPPAEYSINFGRSYKEVFGEYHPQRKAERNFEITIFKKDASLESFIKNQDKVAGSVEQTSEHLSDERVGGYSAKVVKRCDIGGNCSKNVYVTTKNAIQLIFLEDYYSTQEIAEKEVFDRMLASMKIE